MTLPGQTTGVAVFFDPVAADLGLTRAQIALAYTLGTLAGILPAPFIGRWIDRRGPRLAAAAIAIGMGLACVAMASAWSALTLTIGFAAIRGAAVGGLSLVSQHVINLWFVTRRGDGGDRGERRSRARRRRLPPGDRRADPSGQGGDTPT